MSGSGVLVDRVRLAYSRRLPPVLNDTSLVAASNTVTALTGPSGRGKSTLLYVIGLMLRPSAGSVMIDGVETVHFSDVEASAFRAQTIGFIFQDALLDESRSISANVVEGGLFAGLTHGEARARAAALLADVGLGDPDLQLRKPGGLSGGQAQRVALCRALIKRPSVVLADEPTGNLDAVAASKVLATLRGTATAGATVIIATHDPQVMESADTVVRL